MTKYTFDKLNFEGGDIERFRESLANAAQNIARVQETFGDWAERLTRAQAEYNRFAQNMAGVIGPWADGLEKLLAPFEEDRRVAQLISELGLVPHIEMFELVANVKIPTDAVLGEVAQQIAQDFWPTLRPRLELSLDDCLGDQKLFHHYCEIVSAHNAGFYQLTTPGAASVIERAARLAQRHGAKVQKPYDWLESDVCDLPINQVPGWRALSVLIEQTFLDCWNDADADAIRYPNRHAAAHGHGSRIFGVIDSLNAVLVAHFVVVAAAACEKYAAARS